MTIANVCVQGKKITLVMIWGIVKNTPEQVNVYTDR